MRFEIVKALLLTVLFSHSSQAHSDCSSSESSTCHRQVLADYDFYNVRPVFAGDGPNPTWSLFDFGGFYLADDGVITYSKQGAVVNSNPFTKWLPANPVREIDHVKWLGLANQVVTIPANSKVFIEFKASAEVFGLDKNPFPAGVTNDCNDPRMGGAAFNGFSPDSSNVFDFYLTNDRVYAIYERLPFSRPVLGEYAAYTFVVPIKKRKPSDWHHLKLMLDSSKKQVTWFVDGKEGFVVKKVGSLVPGETPVNSLGGAQVEYFPTAMQYGFGTFTLIDFYPASKEIKHQSDCSSDEEYPPIREALTNNGDANALPQYNPVLGVPNLASYWDPIGTDKTHHIWGQGVVSRIKRLRVSVETC